MNEPTLLKCDRRGFALVVTLMMLVLVAILVIGLLTNASTDRLTSASYSDRYQAELAASSGLEAAKQALYALPSTGTSQTQNDGFIVVSAVDSNNVPYYYIGSAVASPATNPSIQYFPLYSGGTTSAAVNVSSGAAPPPTPPPSPAPVNIASQVFSSSSTATPVYYPKVFPSPAPQFSPNNIRTQWQDVPTPTPGAGTSPSPKQYRYTYWVEDLAGYVDANVAGNTNNGTSHTRPLGYSPNEVASFTLFKPSLQVDDGTTYASTFLVPNHPLLFTRQNTRVGTTASSSDDNTSLSSLVANLQPDYEQSIIPYGMGYKNQGRLKTNLNQLIADIAATPQIRTADAAIDGAVPSASPAASPIIPTITDNLPNFASARQGGLSSSSEGYLETLAANIIDYVDSDSTPTVGTNSVTNKHYRGIDLMPFVTEVYDLFYWDKGYYQNNGAGDYYVDIRVRTYVNVWNMFSRDISSGTLTFNDKLQAGIQFGKAGTNRSTFDASKITNDLKVSLDFSNLPNGGKTLAANEYRPLIASERVYTFDIGPTLPTDSNIYVGSQTAPNSSGDTNSLYEISWNGVLYDRPGSLATKAMDRASFLLVKGTSPVNIVGTVPGLSSGYTSETAPYNLGDPRGNYYLNYTQWSRAYIGESSWGGRVFLKKLTQGSSPYRAAEARLPGWTDGGHNSTAGINPAATPSVTSTSPLKLNGDPTNLSGMPTPEPSKAPARISNRTDNRINSITELSYIYDPFQWDPFTATPSSTPAVDSAWQSTWKNNFKNFPKAVASDAAYGSHSTLRIGRPEHKSFDKDGTRAWQLLDVFSAGDPSNSSAAGATTTQLSTRGKININTASTEALRALGGGIQIGNLNSGDVDQAIQPSSVYGPQSSKAGDLFAQYVTAQRMKQPFLSASQLAAISGLNNEPFFGNPNQWTSGAPTEWNDAASEEYLAKIYNFATVRSRNFRVFVTGQYIDPNTKDPYTNQSPRVIATANKVYEVFLKPIRDSAGAITDEVCQITYSADLQ